PGRGTGRGVGAQSGLPGGGPLFEAKANPCSPRLRPERGVGKEGGHERLAMGGPGPGSVRVLPGPVGGARAMGSGASYRPPAFPAPFFGRPGNYSSNGPAPGGGHGGSGAR